MPLARWSSRWRRGSTSRARGSRRRHRPAPRWASSHAEPLADVVHVAAVPHRVGAGEVDELERAARACAAAARGPGDGAARRRCSVTISPGCDLARCRHSRASTARTSRWPRRGRRAAGGRPTAAGSPTGRARRSRGRRPAAPARTRPSTPAACARCAPPTVWPPAAASISVITSESLVAVSPKPAAEQLVAQRRRVDEVAVVGERQRAVHRLDEERLDVALGVRRRWSSSGCGRWRGSR